jgi:arylsulfatase
MFGNRALYYDGWYARTIHRAPWEVSNLPPLEEDVWDLYNTREDFSLTNNLAAEYPEKLEQMKSLFMWQAEKYHVLPIDDRVIVRMNAEVAGRQISWLEGHHCHFMKEWKGCWKIHLSTLRTNLFQ